MPVSKRNTEPPSHRATEPAEMSAEVIEFIQAIDEYKRLQQRPSPSWIEVLDLLKSLGYTRPD